jgi:hypothetical protein
MTTDRRFAERQIRSAVDESLAREENDRAEDLSDSQRTQYACECTHDCDALISLTTREYEDIRKVPTHFLAALGHLVVGVEVVVLETANYQVVEKIGAAVPVATRLDPRTHTPSKRSA